MSQNVPFKPLLKSPFNTNLLNYLLFQSFWAVTVFLPNTKSLIWVLSMMFIYLSLHILFIFKNIKTEILFVFAVASIGILMDGFVGYFSLIVFKDNTIYPLPPLWIGSLWIYFSSTLRFSLNWIFKSHIFTFLFGAVGGPLTYYVGENLLLLRFKEPLWLSLLVYGICWGILLSLVRGFQLRSK